MTRQLGRGGRIVFASLLAAWCGASFLLSSQSDPEEFVGVHVAVNDKVVHGLEYSAGGLLAAGAFGFLRGRRGIAAAVTFCGVWGASDEWHQSFVPGRDSSVADLGADVAGATAGGLAFAWIARRAQASHAPVDESDKSTESGRRS